MSPKDKPSVGDESDESDSKEDNSPTRSIKQQSAPLFAALEHGAATSLDGILSTEPFVSLMAKGQDRDAILDMIRSPKFQKPHARRLFNAILPIIEHVAENESYVPLSAFDDEEEEDETTPMNDSNSRQEQQRRTSQESRKRRSTEFCATSNDEPDVITPDEASTRDLLFLKYSAMTVNAYLDNLVQHRSVRAPSIHRVFPIVDEVWKVADYLHDILFSLHSCGVEGTVVQKTISSMCERYWKGQFADREALTTQLIPLLVVKTLSGDATKADLKRLWDMRSALTLLDFKEESGIAHLKTLLLRTVSSPLYLKHREGWKIIAFIFQLDCELIKDLHAAIRVQIPLAKRKVLEAYGNIYWSAWKTSSTAAHEAAGDVHTEVDDSKSIIQESIEENTLQDLMHAVLHVSSPHMARSLRILLEPIHSQKKTPEVDQLLYRMYGPILWRALSATNPLVRIHASSIFAETFPLHDPLAGKIHLKAVTEKSVETLTSLLNDYDPKVRVAGCDAAVRILGMYWDALSTPDIRIILKEIIMSHANDTASAAVRAQAIQGISLLLDAESSHAVLKPLLPLLGNLIHDSVERVRLATVKLLLKLKSIKGIKYYHVVPSHHLLARLAAESDGARNPTGSVASALTGLMCNSYFPKGVKGSEQMRRTILFLSDDPKAARVFYSNLANHLDVNNICKLIAMLVQTLQLEVTHETKGIEKSKKSKKRRRGSASVQEENNCNNGTDTCDTTLMAEVAETIVCLWNSVRFELKQSENEPCLAFLEDSISGSILTDLFSYFGNKIYGEWESESDIHVKRRSECHRICSSILSCAGMMTPDTTAGLPKLLESHIGEYCKVTRKRQEEVSLSPVIALFCSWGLHQDVATSFYNSISSVFGDDDEADENLLCDGYYVGVLGCSNRSKRKQSSSRKSDVIASSVIPELPAITTLKLIGTILNGTDSYSIAARDALLSSETACSTIENALEKGTIVAEKILTKSIIKSDATSDQIEMVLAACEAYGRLALHKAASKDGPLALSSQISTLLTWVTNRALPALTPAKELEKAPNLFDDMNLSRISTSPASLSPLAVPPPRRRSNLNVTPTKLDSSFLSMERNGITRLSWGRQTSSILHKQAMGLALVKSALFTISEWVLIGGQGSQEISEYAQKWSKEVIALDLKSFDCALELFPAFTRLALILGRRCLEYGLFKEILVMANGVSIIGGTEILEIVKCALTSIMSIRGATLSDHAEKLAHVVVELSENIAAEGDYKDWGKKLDNKNDSLDDFIPTDFECLTLAVRAMMSNGKGILALAKVISKRHLATNADITKHETFLDERFLKYLIENVPRGIHFDQLKEFQCLHSSMVIQTA